MPSPRRHPSCPLQLPLVFCPRWPAGSPDHPPGTGDRAACPDERNEATHPDGNPRELGIPDRSLVDPQPEGCCEQPSDQESVGPIERPKVTIAPDAPEDADHDSEGKAAEVGDRREEWVPLVPLQPDSSSLDAERLANGPMEVPAGSNGITRRTSVPSKVQW